MRTLEVIDGESARRWYRLAGALAAVVRHGGAQVPLVKDAE
jgi:hypothetical protein